MASADKCYPDYLNPFGDDEEDDVKDQQGNKCTIIKPVDEYPDYLSPFDDIGNQKAQCTSTANDTTVADDYDDSLNPFGDEEEPNHLASQQINITSTQVQDDDEEDLGEGNPFGEDVEEKKDEVKQAPAVASITTIKQSASVKTETLSYNQTPKAIVTSAPPTQEEEISDKPPVPLPRTKSLLKKELAAQRLKQLQLQQQQQLDSLETSNHATRSSQLTEKNDSLLEEEEK